jgi:hypothetical protein
MTDAQLAQQIDPTSFVNEVLSNADENSVDEYLDELDGPSEDELKVLGVENDLDNEEME